MNTITDEATALGLAVRAVLTRPELGPELSGLVDVEARIKVLLRTVEYLQATGQVSETHRDALVEFVTMGSKPGKAFVPEYSVGSILLTTAQRYPYYASTVVDVYAALAIVANAAVDGFVHGGPLAATGCASVAAVRMVAEAHKE